MEIWRVAARAVLWVSWKGGCGEEDGGGGEMMARAATMVHVNRRSTITSIPSCPLPSFLIRSTVIWPHRFSCASDVEAHAAKREEGLTGVPDGHQRGQLSSCPTMHDTFSTIDATRRRQAKAEAVRQLADTRTRRRQR